MTTATIGFSESGTTEVRSALEEVLVPRLLELLCAREPGHCMRVTELDAELSARLARRLRSASEPGTVVCVLGTETDLQGDRADVVVTSTKLVELRNRPVDAAGGPLLVFVPPGTRASAEDSFGVATFEEHRVSDAYESVREALVERVPPRLRNPLEELGALLREKADGRASDRAWVQYLLTIAANDYEQTAAGAALYCFGLVPDLEAFTSDANLAERIRRNRMHVDDLTRPELGEQQRVVTLGLPDAAFVARLAQFAGHVGLENRKDWTRRIIIDRGNRDLTFDRWPVPANREVLVDIDVRTVGLPDAGDDPRHLEQYPVLDSLAGQPYLVAGPQGAKEVEVRFTVSPALTAADGLLRLRVEMVSDDGGPVGRSISVQVGARPKSEYKATIKNLRATSLDEGWHKITVHPVADADRRISVRTMPNGNPGGVSSPFWVVNADETEVVPEIRSTRYESVAHALEQMAFQRSVEGRLGADLIPASMVWSTGGRGGMYDQATVDIERGGKAEVRLSRTLTSIERATLGAPRELGLWQVATRSDGSQATTRRDDAGWVVDLGPAPLAAFERFLEARDDLFAKVAGSATGDPDEPMPIVETVDVNGVATEALAYATAYYHLLNAQGEWARQAPPTQQGRALRALAGLQQVDAVAISHVDALGSVNRILLLGPTHPLRVLWFTTWTAMGAEWRVDLEGRPAAAAEEAMRSFFGRITNLGLPFAVPRQDGRLLASTGHLTPFWAAYVPSGTGDSRTLLTQVAAALGVPDAPRPPSSSDVSGPVLADRVEKYVRQHPYVRTLVVNVVNAGDGALIAETLLELQRRPLTRDLAYDIRLCVHNTETPGVGEALAELTRTDSRFTSDEAEAFAARRGSRGPKLTYSVTSLEEFESKPGDFEAHLSVLVDAFDGEQHESSAMREIRGAPANGLVQQADTAFEDDGTTVTWRKTPVFPRIGDAQPRDLLAVLPRCLATAAATVATNGSAGRVPSTTLSLDGKQRSLLHQAHEMSDWVVIVDRTLGLEYFDRAQEHGMPDYVIDYASGRTGLGYQVLVSSRKVDELRAMLKPVVADHGVSVEDRHIQTFFEQLRLLSGTLAFKIASVARNQRTEVLGLALARLFLDGQQALDDQLVVPLDAHPELYAEARRMARGTDQSLRRTDLALFSFDAMTRTITCRLVEVKAYTSVPDLTTYQRLQTTIKEQLRTSEEVLATQFDPHRAEPDRVDRTVKNLELSAMLRFYFERAERYGSVNPSVGTHARRLLETLDDGFTLAFRRAGLIFNLTGAGGELHEVDGVEYHHVGRDEVDELLGGLVTVPVRPGDRPAAEQTAEMRDAYLTRSRRDPAAFRAPTLDPMPEGERVESSPAQPTGDRAVATESVPAVQADTGQLRAETGTLGDVVGALDAAKVAQDAPTATGQGSSGSAGSGEAKIVVHAATSGADGEAAALQPSILVGVTGPTPQWGMLGEAVDGRKVGVDLNETHTISLFGVQGGGKSYTLGSIIESATLPSPGINHLPRPLSTIVFHYSRTQDYAPEFSSMVGMNDVDSQVAALRERYGAEPAALDDVLLLAPSMQVDERRAEFPGIRVEPLLFSSTELQASHWTFLLGAVGNQAMYMRQLKQILRANRARLSLDTVRQAVEASSMADNLKELAQQRLELASEYIDDTVRISDHVRPGRLIIVDLRDEYIEKDESLGLFVVLMQLFAEAKDEGGRFNKLVVFDEAHKYIDSNELVDILVESVREMRHKGMSILVASQDPPSVPVSLIELSDHIVLHRMNSPAWLKHIQKANAALSGLRPEQLANLKAGEAYVWASKATESSFTRNAVRVSLRPRVTRHGGATKTATS
ncbi:hypothetical protein ACFS27_22820 [Promicromonospora vindobonensis]|uniref:ATP-binding protein n=1 Tax=Promicromonospora vindobonensis TaxID=195748 RepID=A0ABW5VY27_9MICO